MENQLDDIIIKAISNPERKNILKIVGSYTEGVNYKAYWEKQDYPQED